MEIGSGTGTGHPVLSLFPRERKALVELKSIRKVQPYVQVQLTALLKDVILENRIEDKNRIDMGNKENDNKILIKTLFIGMTLL